ncbi:DNA-binding MarR family transcriptional regulator [Ochrobactrum daejeonense]|uniref:DNA-binding MarR family transcriptional regulator n=1 Tax=Brucella daejeonensis TaxID=659015 RepID=A0A7W9AYF1_9HYPH|nr:MarR family transcriptional regulator [Brucella daejeonensis]MBB5702529.1 DNA-binding MarR family transcriptional regulator [Brucella daejeonensis]NKB79183.1 MarR family transcriptional regulator [Brucella daejeonensis]
MTSPCFCILLRQAARKTSTVYDEALAPLGINVGQFSILRKVRRAGSISLTELARLSELDRSTMGRNARVLQRMGLLAPAQSDDHRETSVTLTAEGHDLVERGAPLWDKAQDEIEARLGSEGVGQLQALLRSLD